jgi:hypothetical protein
MLDASESMSNMTIAQAMAILIEELRARENLKNEYDEEVTEALRIVLDYAKRSAPR